MTVEYSDSSYSVRIFRINEFHSLFTRYNNFFHQGTSLATNRNLCIISLLPPTSLHHQPLRSFSHTSSFLPLPRRRIRLLLGRVNSSRRGVKHAMAENIEWNCAICSHRWLGLECQTCKRYPASAQKKNHIFEHAIRKIVRICCVPDRPLPEIESNLRDWARKFHQRIRPVEATMLPQALSAQVKPTTVFPSEAPTGQTLSVQVKPRPHNDTRWVQVRHIVSFSCLYPHLCQ